MARNVISGIWDSNNLGGMNDNFVQLFAEDEKTDQRFKSLSDVILTNTLSVEQAEHLIDASPKEVFKTLSDLKSKYPNGKYGVYLTTDNGHWYYYDKEWKDGGVYQASGAPTELSFSAENLIQNGDFQKGITGFSIYGGDADFAVSQGAMSLTGKGSFTQTGITTAPGYRFKGNAGNTIFVKVRMRARNNKAKNFRVYASEGSTIVELNNVDENVTYPSQDVWYDIIGTFTVPESFNGKDVLLTFVATYPTASEGLNQVIEIYRPFAMDVTAAFGKGLEPPTPQLLDFLNKFPNSYFSGIEEVVTVKDFAVELRKDLDKVKSNGGNDVAGNTKDYELVEDFSSSDWVESTQSTALSVKDDGRHNITGTTSKKLTVTGLENTSLGIDKVVNFAASRRPKMVKLWVEDPTKVNFVNIYFGNESDKWANYTRFVLGGDAGGNFTATGGVLRKGWNFLSLNNSEAIQTNNFSWDKPIKKLRVMVSSKSTDAATVVFDSIYVNGKSEPKFIFTFDDAWRTVYENAFPKLKSAGIPATNYVIGEYIDNVRDFSNWFQTVPMLKEMENEGWCNANHTWQHNYFYGGGYNAQSYVDLFDKNRTWLLNNGIGATGASHVCYPNGEYDEHVISLLRARGFKSGRAAGSRGTHPLIIDDEFQILSRNFHKDVTLEQAKKWVDIGVESGGTTFFQFHQIPIDDTTSNGQENPFISWSESKFIALIDYIVSEGLVNNCVTHDEWYQWAKRTNQIL